MRGGLGCAAVGSVRVRATATLTVLLLHRACAILRTSNQGGYGGCDAADFDALLAGLQAAGAAPAGAAAAKE